MTTTGTTTRLSRPVAATIGVLSVSVTQPLTEFATTTFGTDDKLVLLGAMFAAITLVGAAAGLLSRTRPRHGIGILAAMRGLAAAAVR